VLCSCSSDISLAENINKAENSGTVRPDQETNLGHPKTRGRKANNYYRMWTSVPEEGPEKGIWT